MACRATGWPNWPATNPIRSSCRSAASTTHSSRNAATWSTVWCTRCPIRDTHSSVCTSPAGGRRGSHRPQRGARPGTEGYTWGKISVSDMAEVARTPAFWRFARRHWRTGIREMRGSLSKRRFVAAARAYVPDLGDDDVVPGVAGIRAQALDSDGGLVDDFRISIRDRVVLLRNAPSPAATSSLAIAEYIVTTIENGRSSGDTTAVPGPLGRPRHSLRRAISTSTSTRCAPRWRPSPPTVRMAWWRSAYSVRRRH